jgi:hypothetical protein
MVGHWDDLWHKLYLSDRPDTGEPPVSSLDYQIFLLAESSLLPGNSFSFVG